MATHQSKAQKETLELVHDPADRVLLIGILALAGLALLLEAALVGVAAAGVLIGGGIFSSLSRRPIQR
jgi:hypothetical protein